MFNTNLKVALDSNVCINVINESSILLNFNTSKESFSLVQRSEYLLNYYRNLISDRPDYLIDCILSYDTLLVEYDCLNFDHYYVIKALQRLSKQNHQTNNVLQPNVHQIEVCYEFSSEQYPNDIEVVSNYLNVDKSQIIDAHTNNEFMVFAIGFMPNFAYLGELLKELHMPRLSQPRLKVPAGAVAIADNQTAIYPDKSPGGWHIIGYSPNFMSWQNQTEFAMGDKVVFKYIDEETFLSRVSNQLKLAQSI